MSKLLSISIDVTKIPRDQIKPHQNGAKYVSLDVWINDEEDKYGNHASIALKQSKEERDAKAKKTYIGNGKKVFGWGDADNARRKMHGSDAHNQAKSNGYQPQGDNEPDYPF